MLARIRDYFTPKQKEIKKDLTQEKGDENLPFNREFLGIMAVLASAVYGKDIAEQEKLIKDIPFFRWLMDDSTHPERNPGLERMICSYSHDLDNRGWHIHDWFYVLRGTVLAHAKDIVGDIQVAFDQVPLQVIEAQKYLLYAENFMRQSDSPRNPWEAWHTKPFYIIGHSLGAVNASCVFSDYGPAHNGRIKLVTFDNPGSYGVVRNHLKEYWKMDDAAITKHMDSLAPYVHNFLSDVNIVNTCGKQWGNVYRIAQWKDIKFTDVFSPDPPPLISIDYYKNLHYILNYSLLDQHAIIRIGWGCGDSIVPIFKVFDHPAGFANGYRAYLDGEKRKDYWKDYFEVIWDNVPSMQETFKNKHDTYIEAMYQILDGIQHQVSISEENIVKQEVVKFKMNNLFTLFKDRNKQIENRQLITADSKNDDYEIVSSKTTPTSIR